MPLILAVWIVIASISALHEPMDEKFDVGCVYEAQIDRLTCFEGENEHVWQGKNEHSTDFLIDIP